MKRSTLLGIIVICLLLNFSFFNFGQKMQVCTINIDKKEMPDSLPFDTEFVIRLISANKVFKYVEITLIDPENIEKKYKMNSKYEVSLADVLMPPLKSNQKYQLQILISSKLDEANLDKIRTLLRDEIKKVLDETFKSKNEINERIKEIEKKIPEILKKEEFKKIVKDVSVGSILSDVAINRVMENPLFQYRINDILTLMDATNANDIIKEIEGYYEEVKNKFKNINEQTAYRLSQFNINTTNLELLQGQNLFQKLLQIIKDNPDLISRIAKGQCTLKTVCDEAGSTANAANSTKIYTPAPKENLFDLKNKMEKQKTCYANLTNEIELIRKFLSRALYLLNHQNNSAEIESDRSNITFLDGIFKEIVESITEKKINNYLNRIKYNLDETENLISKKAEEIEFVISEFIQLFITTSNDFATRGKWYIIPDVGIGYATGIEEVIPYFGLNFYFHPINKNVPLRILRNLKYYDGKKVNTIWHQISFMLGITMKSIALEEKRENLISNNTLIGGVGCRLTDSIRFCGGALLYKKLAPDTDPKIKPDLFLSLSLDLDLKEIIGDFIGLLKGK